jgi:tetratricopeptide (TPR) repeat protein
LPTTILSSLVLLIVIGLPNLVLGEGGYSNDRNSPLTPIYELIKAEKYQGAVDELSKMLDEKPMDADLLNLLAYSQRKLMRFDEALVNYQKALQIEPEHRGANEYLGELYLQTGQLDKAVERLKVLDEACYFGCDEFDELEQAIENYRSQNPS